MPDAVTLLLTALLLLMPRMPRLERTCIESRREAIEAAARAADASRGVPPGILLVVGMLESHLGCARASGGCWGAPIDPQHRLTAGTPDHAARALATSYGVCRSWQGAVSRFRCGLCRCPRAPERGYTAAYAIGLVERMYAGAGLAAPEHLRPVPSTARRARAAARAR